MRLWPSHLNMPRTIGIIAGIGYVLCTLGAIALMTWQAFAADVRVIDGDTIQLAGEKIRILDIDTPETWKPRCAQERAVGLAAKARLVGLLSRGQIAVDRRGRDRYGRTLAVVHAGGVSVGEVLLREGHALPYRPGAAAKAWRMAQWCPVR